MLTLTHTEPQHPGPFRVLLLPVFAYPFHSDQEMLTHRMNQKLWLVLSFTDLGPNLAPAEAAGRKTMLILSRSWNWPLCCILKRGQLKEM